MCVYSRVRTFKASYAITCMEKITWIDQDFEASSANPYNDVKGLHWHVQEMWSWHAWIDSLMLAWVFILTIKSYDTHDRHFCMQVLKIITPFVGCVMPLLLARAALATRMILQKKCREIWWIYILYIYICSYKNDLTEKVQRNLMNIHFIYIYKNTFTYT